VSLMVVLALSAAAVIAAGCGSDDNKPAYCSDVSDLKQSVDDLKNVQLNSGALSTLQTDLQKIQSNANAVVTSAKQDFPSETSALESSVSSLSTAIKQLPSSPTPKQLASLVPEISGTVTAAKNLENATSSACD
jgi:outer membrane murein-binding lipoprotein Lpp